MLLGDLARDHINDLMRDARRRRRAAAVTASAEAAAPVGLGWRLRRNGRAADASQPTTSSTEAAA